MAAVVVCKRLHWNERLQGRQDFVSGQRPVSSYIYWAGNLVSRKLNLASLLLIPSICVGCAIKQSDRNGLKKQEVICGPQIAANYTVPQWGVLPATSAPCCLPTEQEVSYYEEFQSIVAPSIIPGIDAQPYNGADQPPSLPEETQPEASVKKPAILAPGLIESPTAQPVAPAIDLPPPLPTPSPSDVNLRNDVPLDGNPSEAGIPTGSFKPDLNLPQIQPPEVQLPQVELPQIDLPAEQQRPQVQIWNDFDLPTVPRSYQAGS